MKGDSERPVVCVLEWNSSGHHLTYLRLYTRALLRLGCRLVVLCPDPAGLEVWWAGEGGLADEARSRARCRAMPPRDYSMRKKPWRHAWRRWRHLRATARTVAEAEAALGARATLVFFSCIYEREAALVARLARGLRRAWAGLYLQAESYRRPDAAGRARSLWRTPGLAGLLTLDEEMAPQIARDAGVPVRPAPDLVDTARGEADPGLAARIAAFRAGRPLAGLFGHLQPSKGVPTFVEAAGLPGAEALAFLLAGEVAWELFPAAQAEALRAAVATGRVLLIEGRIASEAAYNELVASCDVLFAAYHDFPHSSNTLGKAAALGRPVVVSEGGLMARRAIEHRLGAVVPQGDAGAALQALLRLALEGGPVEAEAGRAGYLREHGEEALARALGFLLEDAGAVARGLSGKT